jgi:homopolymeric O-antigen transport system ATP-binding protein
MADEIVIRADGLGKKYLIGHRDERERYVALRDVLARGAKHAWQKTADLLRGRAIIAGNTLEEFWALRNVSFEVKRGEVLGIIGRNGAGKTTLLKILSRITEPTEGRVTIHGRVASLLEVGTGFHPELTGRENIYLNGAILGMSRAEIKRKFDAIVSFAEVEKFLDTPVKRYSSGMYVRLAFAVAAHLDPEILVVDEVLAVGDVEFQKKCLGKMSEVASGGRTVLFVSHNLAAIETLCPRSLYLSSGALIAKAPSEEVAALYLEQRRLVNRAAMAQLIKVDDGLAIERITIEPSLVRCGDAADIRIGFRANIPGQIREFAVILSSTAGVRVAVIDLRETDVLPLRFNVCHFEVRVRIASLPLVEGDFTLGLWLVTDQFMGELFEIEDFTVAPSQSLFEFAPYPAAVRGVVVLRSDISVNTQLLSTLGS